MHIASVTSYTLAPFLREWAFATIATILLASIPATYSLETTAPTCWTRPKRGEQLLAIVMVAVSILSVFDEENTTCQPS